MRRAIVVFLEDKSELLLQFGGLYTSFKYIQSTDTDLVVFGTHDVLKRVPKDCIVIEYDPSNEPDVFQNYRFIFSISCLASHQAQLLDQYDLILRTDVDTFLTPKWNTFYPALYTVGRGAYVNDKIVKTKINSVGLQLGLNHRGFYNIGSTHYGNSQLVREVCRLTTAITKHLLVTEFKKTDGYWPSWYKGVSTMYGSEIAVNHMIDQFRIDEHMLDFDSTSQESIHHHAHIHCWHTDNMFSKFAFSTGKYDDIAYDHLDLNKVRDYCLYMALKSKRDRLML